MKLRREYRFYGTVQGVGFRYTAMHLANMLGLTGWVYNDYDGSVVMQVQGEEETIETLVTKLDSGRFINIESKTYTQLPLSENESVFYIRDDY